jgi:hypothetical protein
VRSSQRTRRWRGTSRGLGAPTRATDSGQVISSETSCMSGPPSAARLVREADRGELDQWTAVSENAIVTNAPRVDSEHACDICIFVTCSLYCE